MKINRRPLSSSKPTTFLALALSRLGLSNNVAPNTFQDEGFIYNSFDMKNVDTTRIDLIIP